MNPSPYGPPSPPGPQPPPSQPGSWGQPSFIPPHPKKKSPVGLIILIVCLLVIMPMVLLFGGCFAFFAYIGANGPETYVVAGNQMNADYMTTIEDLELIEDGERILYFYSDAILDITDGMYFCTDRKVVVYQGEAYEPFISVNYDEITDMDMDQSTSILEDSTINLYLEDGSIVYFPISIEKGGDKRFYDTIKEKVDLPSN